MAEDNKNLSDNTSVKKDVAVQSNRPQPDNIKKDEELEYKKPDNFLQTLFAGNNTLITVKDSPLEVDDDTRKMPLQGNHGYHAPPYDEYSPAHSRERGREGAYHGRGAWAGGKSNA